MMLGRATLVVALLLRTGTDCAVLPPFTSPGWEHTHRRLAADANVTFWFGVRAEHPQMLLSAFENISNPIYAHIQYMQYLSLTETNALTRPPKQALDTIKSWLRGFDVDYSEATNVMVVQGPIAKIEELAQTHLAEFVVKASSAASNDVDKESRAKKVGQNGAHVQISSGKHNVVTHTPGHKAHVEMEATVDDGDSNQHTSPSSSGYHRALKAATAIHLPDHVHRHVAFLSLNLPSTTGRSFQAHRHLSAMEDAASEALKSSSAMTPAKLRRLYGVPPPRDLQVHVATQSLAAFYLNSFNEDDIAGFYATFNESIAPTYVLSRGNRVNNASDPRSEASLDLQYMTAIAPNATTTVWSMGGTNPFSTLDEPFVAWAEDVLADPSPPLVHSLSYSDDETHLHAIAPEYMAAFDNLLQKMAIRGLSILAASGDDGVMGLAYRQQNLTVHDACARSGPEWPSSSPYVTSVGATMLDGDREIVCMAGRDGRITSGGGFSNIYTRPTYQHRAVEAYVRQLDLPASFYNKDGRGYPDIAAHGNRYRVRVGGKWKLISGTSAACPLVAGMVTLWNDRRLVAGKAPLGFLNPLLYTIRDLYPNAAFHDVVHGNNADGKIKADGSVPHCDHSFPATPNWDAVTGLGTPRFQQLSTLTYNAEVLAALKELQDTTAIEHSDQGSAAPTAYTTIAIGVVVVALMAFAMGFWVGTRRGRVLYSKLEPMEDRPHTP
ncbi:Aste57867_21118 [Aphanomyces stellatus]|uniref:subtilisin n=1 Tax=Aphanomyces stellatus TaxID=120398 RepID=A0A485LHA5_9STRA|nr:hypothetical protein As57867_021050 [Aphanomyces stellatus]VFT97792.1 Aste57867_21118 [Aphanomyces stellatus]